MNTKDLVKKHEGLRLYAYDDKTGMEVKAPVGKLTIGWGYNIQVGGITPSEADYMLEGRIYRVVSALTSNYSWFKNICEPRQAVCVNVAFNVGISGFAGFPKMLKAMSHANYTLAAAELLDSDAARKLPTRYKELAIILETGEYV